MYFLLLLAIAFVAAFAVSALACKGMIGLATRLDFVDRPAAHKQHGRVVPYGGGIGIALGVVAGVGGLLLCTHLFPPEYAVAWRTPETPLTPAEHAEWKRLLHQPHDGVPMVEMNWWQTVQALNEDLGRWVKNSRLKLGHATLAILGSALVLLLIGLRDDKRPMGPFSKLFAQIVCASFVVWMGVQGGFLIDSYGKLGFAGAFLISIGWIVFITNSFNLLDNTDGLAAGVAVIAALCLALIGYLTDQVAMAALMALLAGACAGFLLLNRHPAKLFMGDAGSLFIGFLFGCFTITFTYFHLDPREGGGLAAGQGSPLGLLVPPLLMALPLYDTFSVIYIRLREGRSIFVGDRRHFSHRLLDLGLSVRRTVGVIYLAELAMGLGATLLIFLPWTAGLLVVGQGIIVFTIITLLEDAGRRKQEALKNGAAPAGAQPNMEQGKLNRELPPVDSDSERAQP